MRRIVVMVGVVAALGALLVAGPAAGEPSTGPTADPRVDGTERSGPEGRTQSRTYTYSLATRGRITASLDHFALHVAQTLNDPRGWSLGGAIEFRQVATGGDFTVWLAEAATVPSFSSVCSSMWSCRVGRNVIINQTRWREASPSWRAAGGSIDSYRHYVVNHETGHWLGFGHTNCPGPGQAAPVMQQQSKGLNGCRHNTWPVGGERSTAAARHGVSGRNPGPQVKRVVIGRQGDRMIACDWDGDGRETPAVIRGNEWRIRNDLRSGGPARRVVFGEVGDRFVCGDWDGNGNETVGAVRGNLWMVRNSNTSGPPSATFRFGRPGQRPVVGDWDGNGTDTPGMVDGNVWRIRNRSSTGTPFRTFTFGHPNDIPVVGDWDGNGRSDPGMVRGTRWRLRRTLTSGTPHQQVTFGQPITPLVGRWNGLANDLPGRGANGVAKVRRFAPQP